MALGSLSPRSRAVCILIGSCIDGLQDLSLHLLVVLQSGSQCTGYVVVGPAFDYVAVYNVHTDSLALTSSACSWSSMSSPGLTSCRTATPST
jgi:hypothetical protein